MIRELWRDVLWLYTALKPYRRPRSRGRLSRAAGGHVPPPRS